MLWVGRLSGLAGEIHVRTLGLTRLDLAWLWANEPLGKKRGRRGEEKKIRPSQASHVGGFGRLGCVGGELVRLICQPTKTAMMAVGDDNDGAVLPVWFFVISPFPPNRHTYLLGCPFRLSPDGGRPCHTIMQNSQHPRKSSRQQSTTKKNEKRKEKRCIHTLPSL